MLRKLAITFLAIVVILQAPLAAAMIRCCPHPGSQQPASFSDGCCAPMSCCVISGESTTAPVIPVPPGQELSAVPASTCFVSLIDLPPDQSVARLAKPPLIAHSPPPLAVTGIFLI